MSLPGKHTKFNQSIECIGSIMEQTNILLSIRKVKNVWIKYYPMYLVNKHQLHHLQPKGKTHKDLIPETEKIIFQFALIFYQETHTVRERERD